MSRASKILAILLFLAARSLACELNPEMKYISLSAPVTQLLEQLELLSDPSLQGISVFHRVGSGSPTKLAGGIFLSPKTLSKYSRSVIFFDESRELGRSLKQNGVKNAIQVVSRGMDPFEANRNALSFLAPYLKGCGEGLKKLEAVIEQTKSALSKYRFQKNPVVFFLGKLNKGQRRPELVISNDGFVKYFSEKNGLVTYPGELAYVPWSQRILGKLGKYFSFGIHESETKKLTVRAIGKRSFNVSSAGALTPGLGQIFFMRDFIKSDLGSDLGGRVK